MSTQQIHVVTATILNNQSGSDAIRTAFGAGQGATERRSIVGIILPSTWTACDVEIQASLDGSTWHTVRTASDDGFLIEGTAASDWIAMDPVDCCGMPYIRLLCSTPQLGDREVRILERYFA